MPASASYQFSSVRLILEEAAKRDIKVHDYQELRLGFARLTLGGHVEYIFQTQNNLQGRAMSRFFSDNKVLGTRVLREEGFPVPDDVLATNMNEAHAFLEAKGKIVVKPVDGEGGQGITLSVTNKEDLKRAVEFARQYSSVKTVGSPVVCQEQLEGRDYRILVVNYEHIFVVERIPAHVIADGVQTVTELLEQKNHQAIPGYEIKTNAITDRLLGEQGLGWNDVPEKDTHVRLAQVANSHAGGTVRTANEDLGEEARSIALKLVRHFDLPMVGIDCLTPHLQQAMGKIIELNSCPAFYTHHFPHIGEPQEVAPRIVDMLFPETATA